VTLVVAGPERDRSLSEHLRNSTHCRVLGMVDPPMLELLYKRASAVVVPSLYEGFGLPILEAMARGKVVVAAKSSSLPEVGGEAALYFHTSATPDQLANVLRVAMSDQALRTRLAKAARARAARFTWDRTAAGVAAVIKQTISS
jgi:glycosyltransferase involved in cell wall biosynthesis